MNNKPDLNSSEGRSMLPVQRILCPTDFSEYSRHAIDVARELASYFEAELILLNVISDVPTSPEVISTGFDIDGYKRALVTSSRRSLKKLARRIDDNNEIRVRSVALQGNPSEHISREARKQDVDLIVISSHGRRAAGGLVFGSVAEKALRLTPCPVLVVPAYPDENMDEVTPGRSILSINMDEVLDGQLEQLAERLDAIDKKIEERKRGVDNLLCRRLAEFDRRNEDMQRKFDRLKRSSREAWEEVKAGLADLKSVLGRAASKFRGLGNDAL